MKDWQFVMLVILMISWIGMSAMVTFYKIEMDSYDKRMIAYYDDVFAYLLQNGEYNDSFNYTPMEPPSDLSEGIL